MLDESPKRFDRIADIQLTELPFLKEHQPLERYLNKA